MTMYHFEETISISPDQWKAMVRRMNKERWSRWENAKVPGRITREDINKEQNDYWNLVSENEFIIIHRINDDMWAEEGDIFFNGYDLDGFPVFSDAWDSPDAQPPYQNYFEALSFYHDLLDRGVELEDVPEFLVEDPEGLMIIPNGRL